uniref:Gluzincin n=1 Tax=Rhipicephalus appendiculatus TaxID=34631 RepID=A0A131Z1H3_RHIAP
MNLYRLLCLLTVVCFAFTKPREHHIDTSFTVCNSTVCKARAKLINDSLNTSVDPCDDFYSYACGGWINNHTLPPSRSSYGNFDVLHEELQATLKAVLENMTEVSEETVIKNAKVMYNACVAIPTAPDRRDILLDILNTSGFSQWPITDTSGTQLKNLTQVLEVTGADPIFNFYIDRDVQKLSNYVVQMDQTSFMKLGRNQLIDPYSEYNKNITEAYKKLLEVAVRFVHPNITERDLTTIVCDIMFLEREMANMTAPPEERRNTLEIYHRATISELECNYTNIPLLKLLNKEFSIANITLNESETVEMYALSYYAKLNDYLPKINLETLYNYAGARIVLGWVSDLSSAYRNASFEFSKIAWGVQKETERWEQCVSYLGRGMQQVIDHMYVTKKFSAEAKKEVEHYVGNISEAFRKELENSTWMDNGTRNASLEKLNKMRLKIGYPEYILNKTFLEERYKYVPELNISDHFTNMWRYLDKNNYIFLYQKLRLPYDTESWVVRSAVVNAYYNPSTNDMLYPSGILQGLFYQHGLPSSLNYGSLGSVIGHEITHGFDDEGSQYDADGKLENWWSNQTRTKFTNKAECFVRQYGNITDKMANMTLNGVNTLGENIADNGGVRMAFKAFTSLMEDVRLEGLTNITSKKMFFIAQAMVWCKLSTEASLRMMIQYDPHSPYKYRVNQVLRNMQAFSTVFQCKANSSMFLEEKKRCTLW